MRFTTSVDRTARIVTVLVFGVLLAALCLQIQVALEARQPFWTLALVGLLLLSIVIIPLGLRVTGITLTEEAILIHRPWRTKKILLSDIHKAEALEQKDLSWSLRTFGIGGIFGYYGRFANRKIGSMTWYLTRRDRTVLLRMKDGGKIVIGPDDRDGFLQALDLRRNVVPA